MIPFKSIRPFTGIEIGPSHVKAVRVIKERQGWKLGAYRTTALPPDTLRLSYRSPNVQDAETLGQVIREAAPFLNGGGARVGLSLPSEVVKISLQEYGDLPASSKDIDKIVRWRTEKMFQVPQTDIQIAYFPVFRETGGLTVLLVAFALKEIVQDYAKHLGALNIAPHVISPAAVNHLNFYGRLIPSQGMAAFLGIFENYVALWVLENGRLIFHHGLRQMFTDIHFFSDIEMAFSLFHEKFADKPLEHVCFGSQIGREDELAEGLGRITELEARPLDETRLIDAFSALSPETALAVAPLAAAIGAAQGLDAQRRP